MKRYRRSRTDRKIAGVCGGLGEYFDRDPTIIRLALIFAGALTAFVPFVIAYVVAWVLVPEEPLAGTPPPPPPPPPAGSPGAS